MGQRVGPQLVQPAAELLQLLRPEVDSGQQSRRAVREPVGPLDKFPFDEGEGRLLIETSIRDMTFRYVPNFPAAAISEMEVVLDNTRLYTTSNRSISRENRTIDAKVEIADLRYLLPHRSP